MKNSIFNIHTSTSVTYLLRQINEGNMLKIMLNVENKNSDVWRACKTMQLGWDWRDSLIKLSYLTSHKQWSKCQWSWIRRFNHISRVLIEKSEFIGNGRVAWAIAL